MNLQHLQVSDPDIVRTFSSSKQGKYEQKKTFQLIILFFKLIKIYCLGIINRGDSFRRRRSRSNSLAPVSPMAQMQAVEDMMTHETGPSETFKVIMIGGPEVGKTALLSQFKTSECINAYESGRG